MKLAFCLFKYFPYGGLQRDFLQIAKECINRGHTVDVYTMQWDGPREANIGVQVILVKGIQNHTRIASYIEQVQPYLDQENYDLVVGFNKMPGLDVYFAADSCYQAKVREQRGWWHRLTPRYRRYVHLEEAIFSPSAKTDILLLSTVQERDFTRYYHTQAKRLHLLSPGLDKSRVAPANAASIRELKRAELGLTDDDNLIIMVGSGFKTKGVHRTITAFASLPEEMRQHTRLMILGKDDAEPFEQLARDEGVGAYVTFLGGRDDVPAFLLAADLFVHPALVENTGTVLLEAMVAGLPVLTVDVCGYAHYVKEANAGRVLTSPFKQKHLNKALGEMLLSPERSTWQQNGLTFAKRKDIYSMHTQAVDLIEAKFGTCYNLTKYEGENVYLAPELEKHFQHQKNLFAYFMQLKGEVFRDVAVRKTQRIKIGDDTYFIKQHFGVGWKEVIKNISQLRLPVVSAKNEWEAIQRVKKLGVPTTDIVGYGIQGKNPAQTQSFLITKELKNKISLEEVCKTWRDQPPSFAFKQALIKEVARIAHALHYHGVNHRDFYLCHFLVDKKDLQPVDMLPSLIPQLPNQAFHLARRPKVYVIDLHRAQIREKTPERWIMKDLAGLYFSSKDIALTQRDLFRFMKAYRKNDLRSILTKERTFWKKVKDRGDFIYQAHDQNT